MAAQACMIQPNPDIAGIGVRTSIYTQTLLSFAPPLLFASDGFMDSDEEKLLQTIYSGLLLTSCALLISAFIQATTFGLSAYHALVVLNLGWMVSASALIICIFPTIKKKHPHDGLWQRFSGLWPTRPTQLLATLLVIIHLSAMSALGLWVWGTRGYFGQPRDCVQTTITTVFGHDFYLSHERLRTGSLVLYVIAAFPFVNAIILTALTVGFSGLLGCLGRYCQCQSIIEHFFGKLHRRTPLYIFAVVIQFLVSVRFIVDTELMIHRTPRDKEESDWTFGQTLALLLVVLPFWEVGKYLFPEKVREKALWWIRKLLKNSRRDWEELYDDAIGHINNAKRLTADFRSQNRQFLTLDTSLKTIESTLDTTLETIESALEIAKTALFVANSVIQGADLHPPAPTRTSIDAGSTKIDFSDRSKLTPVACLHIGGEKEVDEDERMDWHHGVAKNISQAREAVIAACCVRFQQVKDEYIYIVGKANLGTASAALQTADIALSSAARQYRSHIDTYSQNSASQVC